jgi:putative Holliday junction resolvase
MRVLGVDYGRRRIGLAISDDSGVLARPWKTLDAGASPVDSAARIATALDQARRETLDDFVVEAVVVGLPRRLSGEDTHGTAPARALAAALASRTGLPVHLQDERLSSHEAEMRLAEREPDWRVRKKQIDAAAAAIVLQDYLDHRQPSRPGVSGADPA